MNNQEIGVLRHPTTKNKENGQKEVKKLMINVVSELRTMQGQFDIVDVMDVP